MVEPDCVTDDLWRKTGSVVATSRARHRPTLSAARQLDNALGALRIRTSSRRRGRASRATQGGLIDSLPARNALEWSVERFALPAYLRASA